MTLKSQRWFGTTVPIKVVLGDLHVFLLMILPGLKTFLESHRELLENWSTIPTMKPSLHLRWITILNRKQAH